MERAPKRTTETLLENANFPPSPFLVEYLGDSSASKVFAHKNAKPDKATVFVRSKPSKVKNWQAKVENTDAHIVYKNEVTKSTTDEDPIEQEMVGKPRNVEQL